MTINELSSAFKAQSWVIYDGKKCFLQGVISQWINGRIKTSAIIEDPNTECRTIYQVKPEDIRPA